MGRQAISVNAIFVGIAALIPIPLLDDIVRRAMMRGAYQAMAEDQGVPLAPADLDALTEASPMSILGCAFGGVWYLFKKVSKKILYFLTVKDAIDWTAEAAVRAELVRISLDRGLLPAHAQEVRAAMDRAWSVHGGSPFTRAVLSSRHEHMDWSSKEGALVPIVHQLARRGGGTPVIERFEQELAERLSESAAEPAEKSKPSDDD